jgi:hypothetical protein
MEPSDGRSIQASSQRHLFVLVVVLLAEEHDLALEEHAADKGDHLVADRMVQVDTVDDGADGDAEMFELVTQRVGARL